MLTGRLPIGNIDAVNRVGRAGNLKNRNTKTEIENKFK
jgi:hypothetical protein